MSKKFAEAYELYIRNLKKKYLPENEARGEGKREGGNAKAGEGAGEGGGEEVEEGGEEVEDAAAVEGGRQRDDKKATTFTVNSKKKYNFTYTILRPESHQVVCARARAHNTHSHTYS